VKDKSDPVIVKTLGAQDLLNACGQTQEGKDAFHQVVALALMARSRISQVAESVVGASAKDKALARRECQMILGEFHSIRGEVLKSVGNNAVKVGMEVTLDALCNSRV
jgi:hypothetical protein